jgi:hypothetical protein
MATVAVDFDGPAHLNSRGWRDGSIYDEPTPGVLDAIADLQRTYAVVIFTCRDPVKVADWLAGRGIRTVADPDCRISVWDDRETVLVSNRKPLAICYIDDRAIRFTSWAQALADLEFHEHQYRERSGLDKVQAAVTASRGGPPPAQIRGFA